MARRCAQRGKRRDRRQKLMNGTGERFRLLGATILAVCALGLTAVFALHNQSIPGFIIVMDTMAGGFFFTQAGATAARNIQRVEKTEAAAIEAHETAQAAATEARETAQAVLTDHEAQHRTLQQRLNRMREDIDQLRGDKRQ